jgi:hypothetical protein
MIRAKSATAVTPGLDTFQTGRTRASEILRDQRLRRGRRIDRAKWIRVIQNAQRRRNRWRAIFEKLLIPKAALPAINPGQWPRLPKASLELLFQIETNLILAAASSWQKPRTREWTTFTSDPVGFGPLWLDNPRRRAPAKNKKKKEGSVATPATSASAKKHNTARTTADNGHYCTEDNKTSNKSETESEVESTWTKPRHRGGQGLGYWLLPCLLLCTALFLGAPEASQIRPPSKESDYPYAGQEGLQAGDFLNESETHEDYVFAHRHTTQAPNTIPQDIAERLPPRIRDRFRNRTKEGPEGSVDVTKQAAATASTEIPNMDSIEIADFAPLFDERDATLNLSRRNNVFREMKDSKMAEIADWFKDNPSPTETQVVQMNGSIVLHRHEGLMLSGVSFYNTAIDLDVGIIINATIERIEDIEKSRDDFLENRIRFGCNASEENSASCDRLQLIFFRDLQIQEERCLEYLGRLSIFVNDNTDAGRDLLAAIELARATADARQRRGALLMAFLLFSLATIIAGTAGGIISTRTAAQTKAKFAEIESGMDKQASIIRATQLDVLRLSRSIRKTAEVVKDLSFRVWCNTRN